MKMWKLISFLLIIVALAFVAQFGVTKVLAQTDNSAAVAVSGIPNPPLPAPTEFPKPLSFLFYTLVPAILPFIRKWIPSSSTRWWIAVIGSGVSGIACVIAMGIPWTWVNVVVLLFAAYGFSQLAWGIWKFLIMDGEPKNPSTAK